MVTYQFDVDDDTWSAWKDTVPRSKSLDTRLVELIEADTEGRVEGAEDGDSSRGDDTLDSEPADGAAEAPKVNRSQPSEPEPSEAGSHAEDTARAGVAEAARADAERVAAMEGWDDDGRLEARIDAAAAAVRAIRDRGQLGRAEAVEDLGLYDEYPVPGQDPETWWRQNCRPVLQQIAEYSRGMHGYVIEEDDDSGEVYDPTEEF